jgi:hypothetical protein
MTRWYLAYWYRQEPSETFRPGGAGTGGDLSPGDGVGHGSAGTGYGPGRTPNVAISGALYRGFWKHHVLPKASA